MRVSRGLGLTLDQLAQYMSNVEGNAPGDRAVRNNNPLNLMYAGQQGAVGKDSAGFAIFATPADGLTAGKRQIQLDLDRGHDAIGRPTTTLNELIASWAPAGDGNNPGAYAANVAAQAGVDAGASLAQLLSSGDVAGSVYTLPSEADADNTPLLIAAGAALLYWLLG